MGYLGISVAAVLWAIGGTFARSLIERGASPIELTEARAWIAAAGLGLIVLVRRGDRRGRAPWPLVVLFGLSIAGANASYYLSLARLPVAVAIVVQYTAPALVVLWSATAERRRPSARVLVALVLAVSGVVLLAELRRSLSGRGALDPAGLLIAGAAAVAFATYMVTGERVGRELGTLDGVFRGFAIASAFWAVFQLTRGRPDTLLDVSFIPGVLFLAVFTTIVPFSLFVWGMGRVQASRAGIVSTLEPVTAAVLAWAWLGERLGAVQIVGAGMVIVGIAIVQSERTPVPAVD